MDDILTKFKALSLGSRIIVIAGAAMIIIGFLPWYSVDLGPLGSLSRNGWQSPGALWSMLAVIIGVAMAAVIAIRSLGSADTIPANIGGFSWPKINMAGGGLAAICVIIKYLNESEFASFGFWLGFIAAGALAVGAFLDFQAERSSAPAA